MSVWHTIDVRGSLRGQEWTAAIAVACLAFTTAVTAVLHVGIASLDRALRDDLGSESGEVTHVELAAGVSRASGHAALRHLGPMLGDARRSPVHRHAAVMRVEREGHVVEVLGVSAVLPELQRVTLTSGRWFSARDERDGREVAVLGRALVDSVFHGMAPHGIRLSRLTLQVVGVAESGAVAPIALDGAVMVTPTLLKKLGLEHSGPPSLLVAAPDDAQIAGAADIWRALARRNDRMAGRLSFGSSRERLGDVSRMAEALQKGAFALSVVLAAASLAAVGALMLTIARGHTRVVGVMRAFGASRTQVVALGVLIGLLVGAVGVGSGTLVAAGAAQLVPILLHAPPITTGALVGALVEAGLLPLMTSAGTSVACFVRLSRRAPADLLA